jgi:hypothetical protein
MQWEMARAASEQKALGAGVGSLQGHVIGIDRDRLSLHGWHLSRSFRTFLARLIVPFIQQFGAWSSCHGSYPALALGVRLREGMGWVRIVTVLFTACHGAAAPTGPWRAPHRRR